MLAAPTIWPAGDGDFECLVKAVLCFFRRVRLSRSVLSKQQFSLKAVQLCVKPAVAVLFRNIQPLCGGRESVRDPVGLEIPIAERSQESRQLKLPAVSSQCSNILYQLDNTLLGPTQFDQCSTSVSCCPG